MIPEKIQQPQVIAFYLPQYHPIAENNEWFGKGFTEWTNVGRAKPLFKGHYQPKVPADLGYYDLRIPEIRIEQAELAKEAGVSAFCYYHYWFGNGKQLLEMPLNEVIRTKQPDFPFCIAWANHSWYKKTWDSNKSILNKSILMKQEYPGIQDIDAHFYSLLEAFEDKRYYKIKGKLAFVLYKIEDISELDLFKSRWQELASENNLPGFYFISYADDILKLSDNKNKEVDAIILSLKTEPHAIPIGNAKLKKYYRALIAVLSEILHRPIYIFDYEKTLNRLLNPVYKKANVYPVIIPNWDNSPRRGYGGVIFKNSTPKTFQKHAEQIFEMIKDKDFTDQIVFLKSWNEWGEGNYMEPDMKFGKGYIYALREAIKEYSKK